MDLNKTLLATALALSSFAASAQLTGSTGSLGNGSSFLTLSRSNVTGGAVYTQSQDFTSTNTAQRPVNITGGSTTLSTVGNWIAAGANINGSTAILSLAPGTTGVSFLWGTPDSFNTLKFNLTGGQSQSFSASSFFQSSQLSRYDVAGYVKFQVNTPGTTINSIEFGSTAGAFEIANVTAVPEPGTYAMLLSGLAAVGLVARRRRAGSGAAAGSDVRVA